MNDCQHEYGELEDTAGYMMPSNYWYICKLCSHFKRPDFMLTPEAIKLERERAKEYIRSKFR